MKIILIILFIFPFSLQGQVITTFAGNGIDGNIGDGGPAISAEFDSPSGVAVDKWGNIYVADWGSALIHKIDTNGIITRFAGIAGFTGYSGDGGPATAVVLALGDPTTGIAVDTAGNVFFSDVSDSPRIRKISTSGIITTVAGHGLLGYSGDGGPATAAKFLDPTGICFDKMGNMYIADAESNNIRKINTSGIISTIAGTTIGFSGDGGPATSAQLNTPQGIAVDSLGNIFIADFYNNRIREIDTLGIISTIAGGATAGDAHCMGCIATSIRLAGVIGVAISKDGSLYFSDAGDEQIQRVTKAGICYNMVGNGTMGFTGDGGPALSAELHYPNMICFDNRGDLLIADKGNLRYRKVNFGTVSTPLQHLVSPHLSVYPNPVVHDQFTCSIFTDTNEQATVQVTDVLGQVVYTSVCTTNVPTVIHLHVAAGLYFITAFTTNGKMQQKLSVQ